MRYAVGAVMALVLAAAAPVTGSADTRVANSLQEQAIELARERGAIDEQGLIAIGSQVNGIPTEQYIDISGIADSQGLSMDESVARYQHASASMDFMDSLAASYPHIMGTAERTGDSSWHISFTGEVPEEARELARSLPFDVTFDSEAPYAREELLGLASELSLTYEDSMVEVDERAHRLVVVSPHPKISDESLSSPLPGVEIEFVYDATVNPGAGAENTHLRAELRPW